MICYPPLRGVRGGGGWGRSSVHVLLKIKRTFEFHVHSGSSPFTTFCMLGTKSQFRTIKSTRFLLKSWQITAVYCLVLLSRSLLTRKKTAISRFTPNKYHYSQLTKIPCNPLSLVRTDLWQNLTHLRACVAFICNMLHTHIAIQVHKFHMLTGDGLSSLNQSTRSTKAASHLLYGDCSPVCQDASHPTLPKKLHLR